MERKLIDLHAHLEICQPEKRFGPFYICECGRLMYHDTRDNQYKMCELELSTDQDTVDNMRTRDEESFVKCLRIHKFLRAEVPRYYTALAENYD